MTFSISKGFAPSISASSHQSNQQNTSTKWGLSLSWHPISTVFASVLKPLKPVIHHPVHQPAPPTHPTPPPYTPPAVEKPLHVTIREDHKKVTGTNLNDVVKVTGNHNHIELLAGNDKVTLGKHADGNKIYAHDGQDRLILKGDCEDYDVKKAGRWAFEVTNVKHGTTNLVSGFNQFEFTGSREVLNRGKFSRLKCNDGGANPPPQGGGNPPPQGGGHPPPQGGGNPPPQGGGNPPPQGGGNPPPQGGGNPPPQGGGNPPPQDGGNQPPSDDGNRPPRWRGGF
ncbi:MAG: hypothetical protein HWE20_00070 [Gammaproteobacteria bacterium]|nr:hypothetical protein [Gammaproteobacteria bacterium]